MPSNHQFEYLPLVLREQGPARFPQAPQADDPTTLSNKANRPVHAGSLRAHSSNVSTQWKARQDSRVQDGLPPIAGIPLLLKIDTSFDLDDLRRQFEFEIVAEQEDGFVIVASEQIDLAFFQQKLTDFVGSVSGSANVAKIHELREDLTQAERLKLVLTDVLFQEWPTMADNAVYICDVSIACVGTWEIPNKPKRNPHWKDETWARRENEWSSRRVEAYEKWDALKDERLRTVRAILDFHEAEILMDVDDVAAGALSLPDSFTLRLRISGKGLKDLVLNYPYLFEVSEPDDIETPQQIIRDLKAAQASLTILPPDPSAPAVCVVDSGIQEAHFLLEPGIDKESSHCFLPGVSDSDVADYVPPGGHGTRVAGAVLHGEVVPKSGEAPLECWVQNARVLDSDCRMPETMFPAAVLREVVKRYHEGKRRTRIFNHSINADAPCRARHMSAWAAEIDLLCNDYDVLVIQSSGNLKSSRPAPRPGIAEYIAGGKRYPTYLDDDACRVANPSQSLQALTVGSVSYGSFEAGGWRSVASDNGQPSAFSRAGLGIWNSIKPEVVEYGGDYLLSGGKLDWISNGRGEPFTDFRDRAVKREVDPPKSPGGIGWTIETRSNWGSIRDIRRNVGTVQKDWAVVKSNALPEDFCIAVRAHRGWSRDPDAVARYSLVVTFDIVGQEIPIYEPLRIAVLELQTEVEAEIEVEVEE